MWNPEAILTFGSFHLPKMVELSSEVQFVGQKSNLEVGGLFPNVDTHASIVIDPLQDEIGQAQGPNSCAIHFRLFVYQFYKYHRVHLDVYL